MSTTSSPLGAAPPTGWGVQARRSVGIRISERAFVGLARAGERVYRLTPRSRAVERIRSVAYADTGDPAHTLDVWRPKGGGDRLPVILYVHGGAFRSLSKNTHWLMGAAFARRGYLVFNVNYRLAPRHKFPTPLVDVCRAYEWVTDHAEAWGGDLSRLVLAGESAGANLVTALSVAACYERPEPWAQRVLQAERPPAAVLPASGLYQITEPERFWNRRPLPWWLVDQIAACADAYLPAEGLPAAAADLADPLRVFERAEAPAVPLPAFYISAGTRDPVLDDSRRLYRALEGLGARAQLDLFAGEMHAFHAFVWRDAARRCWRNQFAFLDRVLAAPAG